MQNYLKQDCEILIMPSLREKIALGQDIYGILIQDFLSPILMPILNECKLDFLVLDMEHGPANFIDIQNFILAKKNLDISLLVRPPKISQEYISKILDMGADGLMIPHVDTPEQVRNIVQWSKYYPDGKRSYGMRHTLINQSGNTNKELYIKQANEKITLLIQVESQESIFNLESMLSEPYIDGIIVGPADLSMDIGLIGDYTNEKFVNLVNKTLSICLNKKKGFGIHFSEVALIKTWKMKGMNIILYSNETNLLKESILNALNELKKT